MPGCSLLIALRIARTAFFALALLLAGLAVALATMTSWTLRLDAEG